MNKNMSPEMTSSKNTSFYRDILKCLTYSSILGAVFLTLHFFAPSLLGSIVSSVMWFIHLPIDLGVFLKDVLVESEFMRSAAPIIASVVYVPLVALAKGVTYLTAALDGVPLLIFIPVALFIVCLGTKICSKANELMDRVDTINENNKRSPDFKLIKISRLDDYFGFLTLIPFTITTFLGLSIYKIFVTDSANFIVMPYKNELHALANNLSITFDHMGYSAHLFAYSLFTTVFLVTCLMCIKGISTDEKRVMVLEAKYNH